MAASLGTPMMEITVIDPAHGNGVSTYSVDHEEVGNVGALKRFLSGKGHNVGSGSMIANAATRQELSSDSQSIPNAPLRLAITQRQTKAGK